MSTWISLALPGIAVGSIAICFILARLGRKL